METLTHKSDNLPALYNEGHLFVWTKWPLQEFLSISLSQNWGNMMTTIPKSTHKLNKTGSDTLTTPCIIYSFTQFTVIDNSCIGE